MGWLSGRVISWADVILVDSMARHARPIATSHQDQSEGSPLPPPQKSLQTEVSLGLRGRDRELAAIGIDQAIQLGLIDEPGNLSCGCCQQLDRAIQRPAGLLPRRAA
jgi:hypothetical protein